MVSANRNRDFYYRNDGFLTPEYWLSSTRMVALKVRTGGSNRAGILKITIRDFDKHYERYISRQVNKSDLAKELRITRPTLDKLIKEHLEANK